MIVIWGAGGHAKVVADIIHLMGYHKIAGFLDDVNPNRKGLEFYGSNILGGQEVLEDLRAEGVDSVILAFGDNLRRLECAEVAKAKGFKLAKVIHPRAIIAESVKIGLGTMICAGVVVGPDSKIGENVIINTCASADHDCVIEDGAHLSPGVHLAGGVTVERAVWVGMGTVVKGGITIRRGSVVGMGSVVLCTVPSSVVAFGHPAKVRGRSNG